MLWLLAAVSTGHHGRKAHWAAPSAADWEAVASMSRWIRKQSRAEWLCLSTTGRAPKAGQPPTIAPLAGVQGWREMGISFHV